MLLVAFTIDVAQPPNGEVSIVASVTASRLSRASSPRRRPGTLSRMHAPETRDCRRADRAAGTPRHRIVNFRPTPGPSGRGPRRRRGRDARAQDRTDADRRAFAADDTGAEAEGADGVAGVAETEGIAALSDDQALTLLVREHSAAIFRVARSIVGDAATAEDVTQETLIKAWKALPEFRGDAPLRAWLLRIAHNTAVSTLRRRRDQPTEPEHLPEVATGVDPSRSAQGRIAVDHLNRALADLDVTSRSIVVLREVEGMSYQEIAEILRLPMPTVKTRLLRARRLLTVQLQEWRS